MKKIALLVLSAVLLAGCNTNTTPEAPDVNEDNTNVTQEELKYTNIGFDGTPNSYFGANQSDIFDKIEAQASSGAMLLVNSEDENEHILYAKQYSVYPNPVDSNTALNFNVSESRAFGKTVDMSLINDTTMQLIDDNGPTEAFINAQGFIQFDLSVMNNRWYETLTIADGDYILYTDMTTMPNDPMVCEAVKKEDAFGTSNISLCDDNQAQYALEIRAQVFELLNSILNHIGVTLN